MHTLQCRNLLGGVRIKRMLELQRGHFPVGVGGVELRLLWAWYLLNHSKRHWVDCLRELCPG